MQRLLLAVAATAVLAPVALANEGDRLRPSPTPDPLTVAASWLHPLADEAEAVESQRRRRAAAKRRARRRAARERREQVAVSPALQAIAACESGGNPRAIGGGGVYRGKYQFSRETWAAVGGSGDPAAAPEAEQDRRAQMLYDRAGPGQWPVCGQ